MIRQGGGGGLGRGRHGSSIGVFELFASELIDLTIQWPKKKRRGVALQRQSPSATSGGAWRGVKKRKENKAEGFNSFLHLTFSGVGYSTCAHYNSASAALCPAHHGMYCRVLCSTYSRPSARKTRREFYQPNSVDVQRQSSLSAPPKLISRRGMTPPTPSAVIVQACMLYQPLN